LQSRRELLLRLHRYSYPQMVLSPLHHVCPYEDNPRLQV
jgi:hypothetical protein